MGEVPADFIEKLKLYFQHIQHINVYALAISVGTVLVAFQFH